MVFWPSDLPITWFTLMASGKPLQYLSQPAFQVKGQNLIYKFRLTYPMTRGLSLCERMKAGHCTSLTFTYVKRLFLDSNSKLTDHEGTTLPLCHDQLNNKFSGKKSYKWLCPISWCQLQTKKAGADYSHVIK